MLKLGPLASYMMGVCFCPACIRNAADAGLDGERVRQGTSRYLEAAFEGQVDEPKQFSLEALGDALPELLPYQQMRDRVDASLIRDLSRASAKPLYLGAPSPDLLNLVTADIAEVIWSSYYTEVEEVAKDARAARVLVKPPLRLSVGVDATPLYTSSRQNLLDKVQAAWDAGADGIFLYNYGLMPLRNLKWLADALR
jgi:hypothetical protein